MKKFIIVILILVICAIAVIAVKLDDIFNKEKNNDVSKNETVNENVSEEDNEEIKEYLGKILNTGVKIVEFTDINDADKEWLYAPLNQCIERAEYDYYTNEEEITRTLNQLYGDDLEYDVRKDTDEADSMFVPKYDGEKGEYLFSAFGIEIFTQYEVNSIEKVDDTYKVNVIEYSINIYGGNEEDPGSELIVGVLEDGGDVKEVFRTASENVKELKYNHPDPVIVSEVLENKSEFNSYDITLEKNDDGLFHIKSVEKVK